MVVVVVVRTPTPNYLRQASQNLGKYFFSFARDIFRKSQQLFRFFSPFVRLTSVSRSRVNRAVEAARRVGGGLIVAALHVGGLSTMRTRTMLECVEVAHNVGMPPAELADSSASAQKGGEVGQLRFKRGRS